VATAVVLLTLIGGGIGLSTYGAIKGDTPMIELGMGIRQVGEVGGAGLIQSEGQMNPLTGIKNNPLEPASKNTPTIVQGNISGLPKNAQDTIMHLESNGFTQAPVGYSSKSGSIFMNRNNDLPAKERGYYKEWDTKTLVEGGRKTSERLVTGKNGEVYYTNTHYGDKGNPAFIQVSSGKNSTDNSTNKSK
jgi:guanyl-specific ribonuclease Sa